MRLSWKMNLQMGKKNVTNEVVLEDQPFHAPLTLTDEMAIEGREDKGKGQRA